MGAAAASAAGDRVREALAPLASLAREAPLLALGASAAAGAAAAAALLLLLQQRRRRRLLAPDADDDPTRAVRVPPPHPGWRAPQKQPPPHDPDAMAFVDVAATPAAALYPLVISAIVPRPVGFVASLDAAGVANLAPYSYFNAMGHAPPIVALGVCRAPSRGGARKDTLANIEATREFTLNVISDWFVEAANHTSGDFPPGVSEFAQSGLTPVPSKKVRPPRVREAAVQLECVLRQVVEVRDAAGRDASAVVIGEVVAIHVADAVAGRSPSGKLVVDAAKLRPVARLGGVTYGRVTQLFDLPRPDREGRYQ